MDGRRVMVSGMKNLAEQGQPAKWKIADIGEATFRQFGLEFEELQGGVGNYSVAIVEWTDGRVEMVRADRIRFLDPSH